MKFGEYYKLTKPGIIRGNILTAEGGFFLASKGHVDIWLFIAMVVGTSLVIASACVFNNYIDRDIDAAMERTKDRALVHGRISARSALTYASILGILGILVLAFYTNLSTVMVGIVGFIAYVFIYTQTKRTTVHGTLLGTISGSMPIVAGYVSVTNQLDLGALLLFLILVFWQMPHFFGIAIYRLDDYAAAKIPVLPVVKGIARTKVQILIYIIGFITATILLSLFSYTGLVFAVVMASLGIYWFWLGFKDYKTAKNDAKWGKKMFLFSLIVILSLSVMLSVDSFLP
ncbi:MAG: heme o synthase [Candidatus Saccharibacteria bacterium]